MHTNSTLLGVFILVSDLQLLLLLLCCFLRVSRPRFCLLNSYVVRFYSLPRLPFVPLTITKEAVEIFPKVVSCLGREAQKSPETTESRVNILTKDSRLIPNVHMKVFDTLI